METRYKHVVFNEDYIPGIDGTTMKVVELVVEQQALRFRHPYLTLGQVHAALAYYRDHREELDCNSSHRLERTDELRQWGPAFNSSRAVECTGTRVTALGLYMEPHMPRAITKGSRLRGVDVLPAHENRASLDRAAEVGRVLFTQDDGLLAEAARRQRRDQPYCSLIHAHQVRLLVGDCRCDLELVAKAGEPSEMTVQTLFLPL